MQVKCDQKRRMPSQFSMREVLRNNLVVFVIILLILVTVIVEPRMLSKQNISNIISQLGAVSIISLGLTIALIGGFVDLSVAGVINLVAIVTIKLINPLGQFPALVLGLAFGVCLGLLNSFVLLSAGATSLFEAMFITYGLSSVYSALALQLCGGATQQMFDITRNVQFIKGIGSGRIGMFTVPVIIFAVILVIFNIFHKKTYLGRSITLVGGNKTAAGLAGIPVKKSIVLMFVASAFTAALGAVVLFTRVGKASPTIGTGYDTEAILSVIVGGTSMKGGKGSVLRTLLGVLLITLMSNCMDLLGVSSYLQVVLRGGILVLAIWLDNRKNHGGKGK